MASQIRGGAFTIAVLLVASTCMIASASNDGQISSVRVVGSVFCDTCFRQEFSKTSHFIKGAPVAVECETGNEGPNFRIEANTNEHGQFEVELPASVQLKRCSASLLQKESSCGEASIAKASKFTLKSKVDAIQTYSAGFLTFRPQTILTSCSNEVANLDSKSNEIEVLRRSEIESSNLPFLPSPPSLPLDQLPPIPLLPPIIPPSLLPPIIPPSLIPPIIPPSLLPPLIPLPPLPLVPPVQHTVKSDPAKP